MRSPRKHIFKFCNQIQFKSIFEKNRTISLINLLILFFQMLLIFYLIQKLTKLQAMSLQIKTHRSNSRKCEGKDIQQSLRIQHCILIAQINQILKTKLFPKSLHIRIQQWIKKLEQPIYNPIWKESQNLHLRILKQMILIGKIGKPFNCLVSEGPLEKIRILDLPQEVRAKLNRSQSKNRQNSINQCNSARNKSIRSSRRKKEFQHINETNLLESSIRYKINRNIDFNITQANSIEFEKQFKDVLVKDKQVKQNKKQYYQKNIVQLIKHPNKIQEKGLNLLKDSLKLLGQHYQNLCGQVAYKQLMEKIVKLGDAYGQNFRSITLDSSINKQNLTKEVDIQEQGLFFHQYSCQINKKFNQTGQQTLQFMNFLKNFSKRVS